MTNISNLLSSQPDLIPTLKPLLPQNLELPSDPTADDLLPVLTAPPFTNAISSLNDTLRGDGLPGGMMKALDLSEEAGRGVKEFLEGLKGLKKPDEKMQED